MAIYHLSVKPISRGSGRSATAASAYRAAELVHDETSGETFDYTRKRGVEHKEIVLPTAAAKQDINWARDRQALWNAAEVAEKRKDARVAREYEVALPAEFKKAQRVELVRGFAAELANRYGVAVDVALHRPHREGDERNYHAHILTTTRQITPTGLGAKSSMEWSDTDRAKRGLSPAKEEVKAIRARWASLTNEYLKEQEIEARIDHRSLKDQGIEREPTYHRGPAISGIEARGERSVVADRWQQETNERLRLAKEMGALQREALEVQQSILDLSGDIERAKREQGMERTHHAGHKPKPPSVEELQKRGREQWLAMREREKLKEQCPEALKEKYQRPEHGLTPEEQRAQGVKRWLEYRRTHSLDKGQSLEQTKGPEKTREQEQKIGPERTPGPKKGHEGPEFE